MESQTDTTAQPPATTTGDKRGRRRRRTAALAALTIAGAGLASLGGTAAHASTPYPCYEPTTGEVTYCQTSSNISLTAGTHLYEGWGYQNGNYSIVMQTDGNLVEYNSSGQYQWASSQHGQTPVSGDWAVMQSDGNFVIYNSANQPVWASGIGHGNQLDLDTNGNLYMTSGDGSNYWAFGNWTFDLTHVQSYYPNITWNVGLGKYHVSLAGSIVTLSEYNQYGTQLWQQSSNSAQGWMELGNVVWTGNENTIALFDPQSGSLPVWYPRGPGYPAPDPTGTTFKIQTDGNMVMYNGTTPTWWTGAYG